MSFLSGIAKAQASQQAAVSGLQLQSSAYGKAIPIVYGTTRIAPNLIWYGDFVATPQSASAGGGKGGPAGGGGKAGNVSGSYTYQTAVALGLCEGPVAGVGNVYVSKSVTTAGDVGLSQFTGAYGQTAWGYLASMHPDQALGYSGVAYMAASSYALGGNAEMPNHNFEVKGVFSASLATLGVGDADPSLVVSDLLSNPHYGAGFPAARIGDLTAYQAYCIANGLWVSPAYTAQAQASSLLDDLAAATNSAFVWSSGTLTLVPYGDADAAANGYNYTAPAAPLYDLTEDDFLPNSATGAAAAGETRDPVLLTRKRPSDALNSVKIECLDRGNAYNPAVIEAKDQALITMFGLRQSAAAQRHMFADMNAARISAQLQLQRQYIRNVYQFTLDQRYVLLDPMDIVTITDASLGLNRQWVRITEITENDDASLSVTAEEYLTGTGSAALYRFQQGRGFAVNCNASAGNTNPPVIFEPTDELAGALEVWIAASGGPLWGGCGVYISGDGDSYRYAGRIAAAARTGTLSSALPAVSANASGPTIDSANTLSVDLSQSGGQLLGAAQSDALSLATLCYADGEYIAYQNAALTGTNQYGLNWLVRGAYGTSPSAHAAGSAFARLDGNLFKYGFTQDAIGTTLYIKLPSFNVYGSGAQSLADVEPYAYTIKGTAFSSPLPDVQNLRTSYLAALTRLVWDEVQDIRSVSYEVRKGAGWSGAQVLGRVAHPPFNVTGDGTYWVSAYSQPLAGLQVYSNHPQDIMIAGAQITSNVIVTYDEQATGWSGSLSGTATRVGSQIVTSGAGNILIDPDYLGTPDILYYGLEGDGMYEIPSAHRIDVGRAAPCSVLISWSSLGQHIYDNLFTVSDFLNVSDLLDYAASANVSVYPEIALSQDGTAWGAWQKYSPGVYVARAFAARMQLQTSDPQVEAILSGFTFAVDVPDREDHYVNMAVATGGSSVVFTPDGASFPAAFNGGPQGSPSVPAIQVTILDAQNGDVAVISGASLSGCAVQVLNGGVGVARNVNLLVQGY